ncbi:MAG: hypothetical protein ABI881_06115 [Betaproteobacteria bacterium]
MTDRIGAAYADDGLDAALRAQRPQPVVDDGFTARVMAALPPLAIALVPAWRKPAVAVLWTFAIIGIALSLPGVTQDLVRETFRVYTAYPVSLPQLAFAVGAAAIAMWTATGYAVRTSLAVEG